VPLALPVDEQRRYGFLVACASAWRS